MGIFLLRFLQCYQVIIFLLAALLAFAIILPLLLVSVVFKLFDFKAGANSYKLLPT